MRFQATLLMSILFLSCARAPIKSQSEAMRLTQTIPSLNDDLEMPSLIEGLEADIRQLRKGLAGDSFIDFGPRRVSKEQYVQALEVLLQKAKVDPSGEQFRRHLHDAFEPYEVYGQEKWGEVFITSYFEPVVEGSLKATKRFTAPLFGVPKDLVIVDLNSFGIIADGIEQKTRTGILRGRLVPAKGKEDLARIVAYPDRAAISAGVVNDQAPVLVWLDPVDAFFIEIQGSGVVKLLGGKELKVGYAAQNGHPYVPIGKFLVDRIPKEKITMQTIEAHLRGSPVDEAQRIMNLNPSYVFFRKLQNAGITFFGTEVVPGRTIATDQTYFPKGTLAFLEFEKPVFESASSIEPKEWQPASRFVFDQDTGGAIRGAGRVDLFWGRGADAKQSAGVMKNKGRLIYFVPRL